MLEKVQLYRGSSISEEEVGAKSKSQVETKSYS